MTAAFDPIEIELLHMRVLAVTDEAGKTIYRTAISPVITEASDYSATLLDRDGGLVAGSGAASLHWLAASRAARAILKDFDARIEPGDVFFSNDPYDGGGVHPSDVFVTRPIFVDGELIAWIVASAHMIDVGGVALGSWAPEAKECYAEAFRMPPVRLFRRGEEVTDVIRVIRANVRMPDIVEMDLRSLIAASHVAQAKLRDVVVDLGVERFLEGLQALNELSATELRRRLAQLPDGRYRSVCWTQWGDELLETPCVLTVDAGRLVFDLAGAPPQVPFFVNSQPFIVLSQFLAMFCPEYVPDLPFNSGVPDCFELRSPEATVVNAQRPAPVGAGHVHIAIGVSEVMMQCVRLAVSAAPEPPFPAACVQGWNAMSATAPSSWGGVGPDGRPDGWMFLEGTLTGSPAAWGRDGVDAHHYILPTVGSEDGGVPPKIADIEVTEAWHPIFVTECRYRRGTGGAGRWRAGSGVVVSFETEGAERLTGQMLGLRPRIPLEGAAGGLPGDRSEFLRTAGDGPAEQLRLDAANVELRAGEAFTVRVANGGGVGDPLDRDVALVTDDVSAGVLDAGAVGEIYGVVFAPDGRPDAAATVATRDRMRRARLGRARPAVAPTGETPLVAVARDLDPAPLYPGVVQRGPVAFAAMSGAPLAVAPAHWTDGCPTIEAPVPGAGIAVVERSYLDPRTGRLLHVEAVPAGVGRSFDVLPDRWTAHPTATP